MSRTKSTISSQAEATASTEQYPDDVVIRGRLCANPQLRRTVTSDKPVTTIRIAVNDGDEATFHSVVVWGRQAEAVARYLKKGRLVEVKGRPQERTYQDQDGNDRQVSEIVAYTVDFNPDRQTKAPEVESGREVA